MATPVDIEVDQNSDIVYQWQSFDVNGNPFPLTGANIVLTARTSMTDPTAELVLSVANGAITIIDAADGVWSTWFKSAATAAVNATPYVYNQIAVFPDGTQYRLSEGTVYINQQVPPATNQVTP